MVHLDDRAQWIILSAFAICIATISISYILAEASTSGHRMAEMEFDLPHYEIRTALTEAIRIAKAEGSNADSFYENVSEIYAKHGYFLILSFSNSTLYLKFRTESLELEVNRSV